MSEEQEVERLPDSDHAASHICWCCPAIMDAESGEYISVEEYEKRLTIPGYSDEPCIVIHRDWEDAANDATGPIPWKTPVSDTPTPETL